MRRPLVGRADVEAGIALLAQALHGEAAQGGRAPVQRLPDRLLVAATKQRVVVEAEGCGQSPEQLGIRYRFAERRDRLLIPGEVEMSPRIHQVDLLELGRRRQDK